MTITVLLFANLRVQAGFSRQTLELEGPATLREAARHLEAAHPDLALAGALCAVNEHYAAPDATLQDGDTLAFFPPVSGG